MRFAQIRKMDISNGSGIGVSLFTQGCNLHCHNCHNPEQWDYNGGIEYTSETKNKILELLDKPYITRLSILGGEPISKQNIPELMVLIAAVPQDKKIWLYTGHTLENLIKMNNTGVDCILTNIDYLVDGPFQERNKDITLAFRGSSNQHIWYNPKKGNALFFKDVTKDFDEGKY